MKHTRRRRTALLAATLCCANAIAQTDWGQIHRQQEAQSRRQNEQHLQQQQQMQIQQQQNQQGLANPQPAPRRLSREERDLIQQDRDAARATQPMVNQINRSYGEAMSHDVRAMAAKVVQDARWGAYALSPQHRNAGFQNMPTEQAAVDAAMAQCGRDDCKIIATYTDVCYAAVYGEKKGGGHFDHLATAPTAALARQNATAACQRAAGQCVVHKEDCTGDALWTFFGSAVAPKR